MTSSYVLVVITVYREMERWGGGACIGFSFDCYQNATSEQNLNSDDKEE